MRSLKAPEKDDLVTVARFGNAIEANLAKTKLAYQKIESYVMDEHIISLMPVYDIGWGGVRLQVKESQAQRAAKVLGGPARGSFWAPHPIVLATHLLSDSFFGTLVVVAGVLFFVLKKFVFWYQHH